MLRGVSCGKGYILGSPALEILCFSAGELSKAGEGLILLATLEVSVFQAKNEKQNI
jgi:hypothetical protein